MSTNNQVMLMATEPLSEVVLQIETLLGIKLKSDQEWKGHIHRFDGACFSIDVMDEHEFENDREIHFESYPIAVTIQVARQGRDPDLWSDLEDAMALYVGSVLFEKFKCKVLVVKNLQRVLRRFEP